MCDVHGRPGFRAVLALGMAGLLAATASHAKSQDVVEFASGAKLEGKVVAIRKADKEFDFSAAIGSRTSTRTYPFAAVHAVTFNGQRHVLTPLASTSSGTNKTGGSENPAAPLTRSPAEIDRIIEAAGKTPPDWFESTELDYPDTLDLTWPLKPAVEGWHNQRNMGQYIWDIINPNPRRWHSGIKLVHHCLTLHAKQPALANRDMETLGHMYFQLLQDYPRAAFWLRKAGTQSNGRNRVALAECYWRLGNRPMALQLLASRTLPLQAIKLLGDMGETERAVSLAAAAGKTQQAAEAFLLAGDALRLAGRSKQAIEFYERVLTAQHRNEEYELRQRARATESIEAIRLFDELDVSKLADGTYQGTTTGYNGPLTVAVDVQQGRLDSVKVTDHQEKQFYSALTDTPRRIIDQQSLQKVDAVSGATITSQAIVNAAARALAGSGG
ncbi:MAG: FMN-binding protein [Planctomycetaceae bacterium]